MCVSDTEAGVEKASFFPVVSGGQGSGCWTEEANLRHHKCTGGHRPDYENIQEQRKVDVSF